MARSNNQDRTGGQAGRGPRAGEPVDHGLPWHGGTAQGDGQAYGQQQVPGQLPWPQGYPQPHPQAQPAALQSYPAQNGYAPQAYAPPNYPAPSQAYGSAADLHHGHYFPQAGQPGGADPHHQAYAANGYPQTQPTAPVYGGQHDPSHFAVPPTQSGYGNGHAYAPAAGPATGQPGLGQMGAGDPRGFDLGQYTTQPTGHPTGHIDPATGRPVTQAPFGTQSMPFNQAPPAQAAESDDDEYEDEDEEEEPRRRFGLLKVLGVLLVAVAVGGGAAYGVKKYGGNLLTAQTKPVTVKADGPPSKARPTNVAAADGKAAERLGGDGVPAVVPADGASGDTPGQARKVQTIAIPAQTPPPLRPTVSIPGVAVEGGLPPLAPQQAGLPPVTPAPAGRAVALPPQAAAQQPAQRAPIVPRVIAAAAEESAPLKAAPARVPVAQAPKAPKGTNDAYSPASGVGAATVATATASPAAATGGGNGFVAVLASQGTAIDARKTLDDLQGKFGEVLGGKPTDVTKFDNPRDGKTYYRAIVGPPGSREAAAAVCTQMKTAGYKECFATAY